MNGAADGCLFCSLQHFTSQREEFEGTRDAVLVWLTEMDLQLTNVEHFSESDVHDKMRQLQVSARFTLPLLTLLGSNTDIATDPEEHCGRLLRVSLFVNIVKPRN